MTDVSDLEAEILMLRDALDDACGGQELRLRLTLQSRMVQLATMRARHGSTPTKPLARRESDR